MIGKAIIFGMLLIIEVVLIGGDMVETKNGAGLIIGVVGFFLGCLTVALII